MDHPYGKQYGQEGNPRAYMTMRDYRNLSYQWGNQQPVERSPNPPRSMREYRDQWMSAPVYHVPSTETSKAWDEPHLREEEGLRYPNNQGETIHTISEKTLMREKLTILTRRLDEMEMKNQHNSYSVNELSASQPSCYNHQSHGHYGEKCQENVQILNQGRPPLNVPFGNSYIQDWKNYSNLLGKPYIPPTDQHASPPQSPQPLQSIHPLEQAMLDLNRIMDDYVEANKKIRAHSIVTVEDNLNKKLDGLNIDFEHKRDNLQDSSEDLIDQQQCPPEEECQSGTRVEEQRVVTVQANQQTETVESSLNKELDGFQGESDQKLDIQQESILKLTNQFVHQEEKNLEEESQEEECLTETVLVEQAQLQPQEGLKVESLEAPEELQDAPVTFWPWTKEKKISALLTEESCGPETGEEPQELIYQPIPLLLTEEAVEENKENISPLPPTDSVYIMPLPAPQSQPKTPTAYAQATYYPLPVAPSGDQVYILPTPAENPKPATPAPKGKSNPPLHAMKNLKRLVASVHAFATTSKKMANAYIAWHSGWFGCGFGFGTPGPRHF